MNNYNNLYKQKIDKIIKNNREYCYLDNINNIKAEIKNKFKDISKIYKYKVSIKTENKKYITHLIGITDEYLVTAKEEKIPINEIIELKIIN